MFDYDDDNPPPATPFSFRDLVWAIVVVMLCWGWWLGYVRIDAKRLRAIDQAQRQRDTLVKAKDLHDRLISITEAYMNGKQPDLNNLPVPIDWSVLDERIDEL